MSTLSPFYVIFIHICPYILKEILPVSPGEHVDPVSVGGRRLPGEVAVHAPPAGVGQVVVPAVIPLPLVLDTQTIIIPASSSTISCLAGPHKHMENYFDTLSCSIEAMFPINAQTASYIEDLS